MTLWRGATPLILASQSASRRALLQHAGLEFTAVTANVDERRLQRESGLRGASDIAKLLAREKAAEVAGRYPDQVVIGADQTLALAGLLFSKPADRAQAAAQLAQLAGKTHELHSAVAVVRDGVVLFETVSVARLGMRPLSEAQIKSYLDVAGDRVTTSVGAYQIESLGIHLFDRIEGDHFTILGLPLLPLLDFLRRQGFLAF